MKRFRECSHMNSMGQQESPLSEPPRPLGSIRQICVSEGRDFGQESYPLP